MDGEVILRRETQSGFSGLRQKSVYRYMRHESCAIRINVPVENRNTLSSRSKLRLDKTLSTPRDLYAPETLRRTTSANQSMPLSVDQMNQTENETKALMEVIIICFVYLIQAKYTLEL